MLLPFGFLDFNKRRETGGFGSPNHATSGSRAGNHAVAMPMPGCAAASARDDAARAKAAAETAKDGETTTKIAAEKGGIDWPRLRTA